MIDRLESDLCLPHASEMNTALTISLVFDLDYYFQMVIELILSRPVANLFFEVLPDLKLALCYPCDVIAILCVLTESLTRSIKILLTCIS